MRIYLSHGASGSVATIRPHVEGLRSRDLDAVAVGLPRRRAEDAVSAYRGQLDDPATSVIGGHSYGGRVASLLAAEEAVAGLVLLSYPLHPPGRPDRLRTEHWRRISCPVLLLSGEADPFARIDLLRDQVRLLSDAELVTYPGLRHGVSSRLDDVLDRVAAFVARLSGLAG